MLLLWIPIRQRPGLGTVSNVFAIGIFMDGTLAVVPDVHGLLAQVPLTAAAIVCNGAATGLYISARFGPGPARRPDDGPAQGDGPLDSARPHVT